MIEMTIDSIQYLAEDISKMFDGTIEGPVHKVCLFRKSIDMSSPNRSIEQGGVRFVPTRFVELHRTEDGIEIPELNILVTP